MKFWPFESRAARFERQARTWSFRCVAAEARLAVLVRAVDRGDPDRWHALQRARDHLAKWTTA